MKGVLDEAPLLPLKKKLEAEPALLCSIVSPEQSYSSSTSVLMTQLSGVSLGGAFVPRMVSATFDDKRCYERLCLRHYQERKLSVNATEQNELKLGKLRL